MYVLHGAFSFFLPAMRQLWQTSDWLLQYGPICLYNCGRNLGKKLEWAEIRHNFASSIRTKQQHSTKKNKIE